MSAMSASKKSTSNRQNVDEPQVFDYKAINEKLQTLLSNYNLTRLNKSLRTILLDYIAAYKDTLPLDFDVHLYDFQLLFELLDALTEEQKA